MAGLAKEAFLPARSVSRTPRALEQAPQTWIGMPNATVARKVSANGGQPTGTTAFATGSRIRETASPRRKICASWPASASAFACRNGNAALVGSSEPQALFTSTFIFASSPPGSHCLRPSPFVRRARDHEGSGLIRPQLRLRFARDQDRRAKEHDTQQRPERD